MHDKNNSDDVSVRKRKKLKHRESSPGALSPKSADTTRNDISKVKKCKIRKTDEVSDKIDDLGEELRSFEISSTTPDDKPSKKAKKSRRDSDVLDNSRAEVEKSSNIVETTGDESSPKKLKKKKKHKDANSCGNDNPIAGNSESSKNAPKKKVKWGENLVSYEKEKPVDPPLTDNLVSQDSIFDILAQANLIAHKPSQPKVSRGRPGNKSAAKFEKLKRRAEEKKLRKQLKRDEKRAREAEENRDTKKAASIEDLNVKKIKSKKKMNSGEDVSSAKKPRLNSSDPQSGRKSITPEREIIPGYLWKDLTVEQKEKFKDLTAKKKLAKKQSPKLNLLNYANYASLIVDDEERTPLTMSDLQHFLIYSMHNQRTTTAFPTWLTIKNCSHLSKVICVILDGLALSDFLGKEDALPALSSFKYQLSMITPYAYNGDFVQELFQVPLSVSQRHKLIKQYGSLDRAVFRGEVFETLKKIYPAGMFQSKKDNPDESKPQEEEKMAVDSPVEATVEYGKDDVFPRTELLLRSWDMIKEHIPVPYLAQKTPAKYQGFVPSRDSYTEVSDNSPIWAVDCEMCQTSMGSELTRISVINENFEVVYESLVKPYNTITNYLTQYSGITKRDLADVWIRLEDVQEDLRHLLPPDVILAGHSVGFDLHAMKLFHPYIIDTSVCFNLSGVKGRKAKLKTLMAELLSERIQDGGASGHDSIEDAVSCLKLLKTKLSKCFEWGDASLGHKMSEEESVAAQQLLLERDKIKQKPDYEIAPNAIIRGGPRLSKFMKNRQDPPKTRKRRERPWSVSKVGQLGGETGASKTPVGAHAKSLFSHLFCRDEKQMLVVGNDRFVNGGLRIAKSKPDFVAGESRLQFSVHDFQNVLPYGCRNAPSSGISLLHMDCRDGSKAKTIEEIDILLQEALATAGKTTENVLFSVLLTGKNSSQESQADNHGLFMMKLIKPTYSPLTIEDIS
ncbi:EXOIII [Nesidiocoris tenuis]|uniref:EXOIII n=1 Tax=Nesidiocoris tenuis TaxID=355587 RepID=A0ABN7BF97_9HEMI|nr:EXOIII [Nesidiocoris tenuis]